MPLWEYLFLECDISSGSWLPRTVNGAELADWRNYPSISDYTNQLGAVGWEMIDLVVTPRFFFRASSLRCVFKRPKL
jgi:hypothetical protein